MPIKLKNKKVIVIGDIMLDRYIWGSTTRVSPEAPVVIVDEEKRTSSLGGAGNVAMNLRGLGADVLMLTVVGDKSEILFDLMSIHGINSSDTFYDLDRPTTTKTRVMSGGQQVCRIDSESRKNISERAEAFLIGSLSLETADAIIVSDYGKGVVTPKIQRAIDKSAVPVFVDSKTGIFFKNEDFIYTPNTEEYLKYFRTRLFPVKKVLWTRGAEGMTVMDDGDNYDIPSVAQQVFDVSGAGDTVVATLCMGMLCGGSFKESAELANQAAGIVVGKIGTAPIDKKELTFS